MKALVFLLMFIGFVFVVIGFVKTNQECPPPIVQFRYIPKTFNEEQNVQVPVTAIFSKMFNDTTPWQDRAGYADKEGPLIDHKAHKNLGHDKDDNSCRTSTGYKWCDAKQKCIRSWEEKCEPDILS
jgi:hypothetical protein